MNRRGAVGKNIRTGVLSMTHQVDSNIDFPRSQKFCYGVVGFQSYIVKLIEGFDQAGTHITPVVNPKRHAHNLKACPIMTLK